MPITYTVVGALVLMSVVAWTLLRLRRLDRDVNRLKRALEESARQEAASERRIRELVGLTAGSQVVNGEEHQPERRRRLWLVPVVAALGSVAAVVRNHPHQIVAGTAAAVSAGVLTLMVVTGAGGSERAEPPAPVPIVVPPRSPSLTSELPSPGPASTTPSPGDGTPTTVATTTRGMGMLPTSVPVTSMPTATTGMPTSTITTTVLPTTAGCLLDVDLTKLVDLCVPALH